MASTHKSLRSSTANKRPTTAIADGQIALNTNSTSPGLFFKDSAGATIIKIGPVHVGNTAPNVSPAAGGSAGNSTGEVWLDTSLTPNGVKIWNGSAWVNATPAGSTTVQGLLELATNAETQAGSDSARAVTPASLQSKVSDSTSTTSSTTIASSTAVKSAYDLANAALPKAGGTITGNLEIGTTGSLTFEGTTADGFETTLAVVDPTADRTITFPNATGNVVLDTAGQTVQFGLGAAATPSITFTGDANTGIYSPGADTVATSTAGTEWTRVTNNGQILFNTTATPNGTSAYGSAFTPQTNGRSTLFFATSSTASQKHLIFYNPNGEVGSISTNASATAYTTSSDYRLKENVTAVTDSITRLQQLKPSRFNFIADPDTVVDGFIAHEAAEVVPECVTGTKDEIDEDGNPVYQGIDQSKLVPLLTAALQEAIAKIEVLETKVAALEGN